MPTCTVCRISSPELEASGVDVASDQSHWRSLAVAMRDEQPIEAQIVAERCCISAFRQAFRCSSRVDYEPVHGPERERCLSTENDGWRAVDVTDRNTSCRDGWHVQLMSDRHPPSPQITNQLGRHDHRSGYVLRINRTIGNSTSGSEPDYLSFHRIQAQSIWSHPFTYLLSGCKVTTINMADDVERLMNVEKCDRVNFQTFFWNL